MFGFGGIGIMSQMVATLAQSTGQSGNTNASGSWNSTEATEFPDNIYATTQTNGADIILEFPNLGIPLAATILSIQLRIDVKGTTTGGGSDLVLLAKLSWDGGVNWTSNKSSGILGAGEVIKLLDEPADLWGRDWTAAELTPQNLRAKLTSGGLIGVGTTNTWFLDYAAIDVAYEL